jgi:hypothetical protein
MPIANAAYARYYEKNKAALVEKMKGRYSSEKKHAYYEENKEKIRVQNADRYREKKATRNKERLEALRTTTTDTAKLAVINDLLSSEKYKTANSWTFEYLEE